LTAECDVTSYELSKTERVSSMKRLLQIALMGVLASTPALAQQRPVFIRDAETEAVMAQFAEPIFSAAGLDPTAVHIYLLQDSRINAFVAGGQNLFLHTGLLRAAEHADQVIGVIAHETGHIAGGHLPRLKEAQRIASIEQILFCTLGVLTAGGAAAGGSSTGGAAVSLCGANAPLASLMKFSRTQESAADQAGMKYLDETGQSSRGMLEFLGILAEQQKIVLQPPPYLQSHPLSNDRMDAVRAHVEQSPLSNDPPRADYEAEFQRIRAKLIGYVDPLPRVLKQYPDSDNSVEARYARSVAYVGGGQMMKALAQVDSLLADHPGDPYFNELKGDILFKNGKAKAAVPFYQAAVDAVPDSAMLLLALGRTQRETNDPAMIKASIENLKRVVEIEPTNPGAWKNLGIAYGLNNQDPEASLALAESAITSGDRPRARSLAERAMKGLPAGSPGWLRAQDIANAVGGSS
jgi:predicted Zn-dependent protease